jgi:integrase/recombinase XerC
MESYISFNEEVNLSNSLLNEDEETSLTKKHNFTGVVVFDVNFKILPLISAFLSYNLKNNKISPATAGTYAKNLTYFLLYLRNRNEFKNIPADEPFLTVGKYVIEEYLVNLKVVNKLSTATIRNRDATFQAFIHGYLYQNQELRDAHIHISPYEDGLLSGPVKQKIIESCSIDELVILIEETNSERERTILQFVFDTGIRRSEIQQISRQDILNTRSFNSQKLIAKKGDVPTTPPYSALLIQGTKGRHNDKKQRMSLISYSTVDRVIDYHASPLYKKYSRKYKKSDQTPAFFNADGSPFTAKNLSKLLERLSKRAIKKGKINKSISSHKLRHGYSYDILQSPDLGENYVDRLAVVQKSLGHSYLSTTEMYTRIPIELYKSMKDSSGEISTKALRMLRLKEKTQLKISISDKK